VLCNIQSSCSTPPYPSWLEQQVVLSCLLLGNLAFQGAWCGADHQQQTAQYDPP